MPSICKGKTDLRTSLKVSDGVALLIGITIGSGIYSTPSLIAGYLESFSQIIVAWLGVGAFVMVGGMIYAELGTRFPETGGEYVYIRKAFGARAGFLFGWAQLFIIRTSPTAGLSLIAADYVGFFVDLDRSEKMIVALGFILLVASLNYMGVERASAFQKATTGIKVFGLVLFVVCGLILLQGATNLLGEFEPATNDAPRVTNLVSALMLIVFTHTGWDRVGYVAGEMKNPREVIPKSMIYGLSTILVIYWATVSIYHYVLGMEAIRSTSTPAADVATQMVGPAGAGLIAFLAIVSAIGSVNGTTMSASRVYYRMANEGHFFRWLDFVHPRFQTPSRAIIAHGLWAAVILLLRGSFENIAAGMVFAILIFYSMTTVALFRYRNRNEGKPDAFHMPGYPVLPALYLAGLVVLLVARAALDWRSSLIDLTFVVTGVPVSLYWFRKRKPDVPGHTT
jgi:APA family basic amino acid/polyamine antiporter